MIFALSGWEMRHLFQLESLHVVQEKIHGLKVETTTNSYLQNFELVDKFFTD
jgi:hypothetical protein